MSSVNISIRKEAYEFLKSLKAEDESFSDVILELREKEKKENTDGKSLLKYAGVLKGLNIDWEAKEKKMKNFRESFNEHIEGTRKKMEQARHDRNG